jgi:microcystin-dependent protein
MAKHYGNWVSGDPDIVPSNSVQYGVWNSNEQYRQKGAVGIWPDLTTSTSFETPLGSIVFALSSGALDQALSTGGYLVPSGQAISTSTYSGLFSAYGYTFGGSGSTFRLPNLSTNFLYLKPTVASGVVPSGQFSGKIPTHSHTYSRRTGATGGRGQGLGGCVRSLNDNTASLGISSSGTAVNRAASFVVYPLLVVNPINEPPFGCVFTISAPLAEDVLAGALSFPVVIPSGQTVSRFANPKTFNTLRTLYGSGNGSTTFQLPDLRGSFLEMANRTTNIQLSGQTTLNVDTFVQHTHNGIANAARSSDGDPGGGGFCSGATTGAGVFTTPATGSASVGDGLENRPSNYSVLFVIKGG